MSKISYIVSWRYNDKTYITGYDTYESASKKMNELEKKNLKPSLHIKGF